ncbi:MAG: glycosyltransferase family 4 protein [Candidatus Omnitrophica bacterium]|nr:glycosyltransferase family 4 protein [Candidatus Omnitrophota bacterium]
MKALFFIRDLPEPAHNGYKKRNFYLIKELESRGIQVILKVESPGNSKIKALFFSLFSVLPFSVKLRTSGKIKKKIAGYLKENPVDIIICDAVQRALNIPLDNPAYKILYEHNIESMIIKRYAQKEKNIFKKVFAFLECWKLSNFEKKMWNKFDCSIACSPVDKKIMLRYAPESKVHLINNGVESAYYSSNSNIIEKNTLIYTGQIGWYPNEDALVYFINEILPLVKQAVPEVKLWIVGNKPSDKIKEFSQKNSNITVTGFVEDVRELMQKACVYIVPLRIGSGTRLKILEALSMKKAVVTTTIGCEGIEVENNQHLLIRDAPEEFAKAVLDVLKNEALRISLGENGRKLIEEKYDWKIVFKDLDKILS